MAINPSDPTKFLLKLKPDFTADTLAELQPAVDATPATYEGKYLRALDQVAGQQLYYVEQGQVIPAFNFANYYGEAPAADLYTRYFRGDGTQIAVPVGEQIFTGVTDAAGQVTIYATDDGLDGGADLFSEILDVQATAVGIPANIRDRPYAAGVVVTGTHSVQVQVARGLQQTILLGGQITVPRAAPAGTQVRIRVLGIVA